MLSAFLLGGALYEHATWYWELQFLGRPAPGNFWLIFPAAALVYLFLWGTTHVAAWLTAWEAAYRGYRLPKAVVLRGLYFHSAHYLPVGLAAFTTTAGYRLLVHRDVFSIASGSNYLVVLCCEVLLGAAYLFMTYWAGMRNMMYANR